MHHHLVDDVYAASSAPTDIFNEIYAPVAKFKSIGLLLAIAANRSQKVFQDDATSAFLNGVLKERVIMDQPEGFPIKTKEYKWLLQKTLCGLKQAPRECNEVFNQFMLDEGFTQSVSDPCLYKKHAADSLILVGLYVDDVITTGNDLTAVEQFRENLKKLFKCSEGGLLKWCLGMEVTQNDTGIKLNQNQYISQKLKEFDDCLETNIKRSVPLDPVESDSSNGCVEIV